MIDLKGIDPEFHEDVTKLAGQMRAQGFQRTDPVREIPALLGDRWSSLILLVLGMGRWRHAELRRVLGRLGSEGRISQRVLTLKLRALERDGLVARDVTDDVPTKVSYELTSLGHSLTNESRRLIEWIKVHQTQIEAARAVFKADQQNSNNG